MATALSRRPRPRHDPTYYPIEDETGEGLLPRRISNLLQALIVRYLAERGERALVGANQFIYWEQYAPTKSVAPDVYVLAGVDAETDVESWKVWETGVVPSFALEVVSRDLGKDYDQAPRQYAELGVAELVIFDPRAGRSSDRVQWQVFRKLARRGFVRVEASDGDRVRSRALGCWLRAVGRAGSLRLRLASGPDGNVLIPTDEERAAREVAARQAADAEVAALREQLARLRRRGK